MRRLVVAVLWAAATLGAGAQVPADAPAPGSGTPAATGCSAEPPPTGAEPFRPEAQAPRDHGFLWRISKDGHASWLYGTLHVGRADWELPGARTLAAMKASDMVALEIDLLDPSMQQRLARTVAAQPRTPLPADLQQRLDRVARTECMPPEALSALAPELRIATLTTLVGRRDGLDPDHGADVFLARWGHESHRAVVSLETPEQQLALLHADSPEATLAFIDDSLGEIENGKAHASLLHIARVWADGDWGELSAYARWCECLRTADDRAAMKRLLDDRNPGMADAIAALHAGGKRVFAAVGSLHMIGAGGLPALMARRGYRVEQITYDRPTETKP